ncbi:MAG: Type 1 glutamine amidotransferase-like domain-containing protein [Candidatus Staskawiczbacteria bacterium]|nr:Type 1 glutamine amidotransferase-like domain-containing protein [Candidatus Staskawiczbacteria bacterium]
MAKKIFFIICFFLLFSFAENASAHQPNVVYYLKGNIKITGPEISRAFYDKLKGEPRTYIISSESDFTLYLNILVPAPQNIKGRYSVNVFLLDEEKEEPIALIDGNSAGWEVFYEPFGRDYYLKGPEFEKAVKAGNYKITVFSEKNWGEYVLAVGKQEYFGVLEMINVYWQLPLLKYDFFKTPVWQFFLTPLGIYGVIAILGIFIALSTVRLLISLISKKVRINMAKTLLLTSTGMDMKEEIKNLLHKPAYDILVAFITTAAKKEQDLSFVLKDLEAMTEVGFNVEKIDIEGKKEYELRKMLANKDIIFVEGGNAYYLLEAMKKSGFEKVIKDLMKKGVVYLGVSAGSIVAGQTIETSMDENITGLKKTDGLKIVPFNVFVHYRPEYEELAKQKLKNSKYPLHALKDDQALLIQGENMVMLGKGEEIIFKKEEPKLMLVLKIITACLMILTVSFFVFVSFNQDMFLPKRPVASFEDCVKEGNPALETYPERCKTPDGQMFVNE